MSSIWKRNNSNSTRTIAISMMQEMLIVIRFHQAIIIQANFISAIRTRGHQPSCVSISTLIQAMIQAHLKMDKRRRR